jgi:hypothetical protein
MPLNVALGIGARLSDAWAIAIQDAQCLAAFALRWNAGKVLIMDNGRMAQARAP